jgi:microcystin-dependent protein
MGCTNCYNGCAETISDQCVKYTGVDIPELNISNGDPLSSVQQSIINFLVPVLDGTGVKPIIDDAYICDLVGQYLPACTECTGFTLNEVLTAIIRAACDLQTQVTANTNAIATLNADYTIGCLTGVTASSDTHDILQAVITNLCNLNASFATLISTLPTTYVSITSFPTLVQAYLNSQNYLALAKDRMIPYAAIPYFGPLSNYPSTGDNFSLTGAGSGYWDKVYLCNGQNGTPDLRGRVLAGVTTGMGGGAFDPVVDPAILGNPNYTVNGSGIPVTEYGANTVTLTVGQIPSHDHPGSSAVDSGHNHQVGPDGLGVIGPKDASTTTYTFENALSNDSPLESTFNTEDSSANITLSIASQGGGLPHNNVQPSRACYYIMYIP